MKLVRLLVAATLAILAPQLAHAQSAALVQKPAAGGNCAVWADQVAHPNQVGDSGIGCAGHELTISDGAHGTLVLTPTNATLPSSPAILNMTSAQPTFVGRGVPSTALDGPDIDLRRVANYSSGGTFGYVNTAIRVFDSVTADRPSFEWAFLSILDNNQAGTQGSQNVAGYFQSHKRFAGAGTWALTAELLDHVSDPISPSVTFEYDLQSKGTDTHNSRVIQDLWAKSDDGNPTTVSYGQRFNTDANSTIDTGILFNGTYTNGINLSPASYAIAALVLGDGQKFCTTALCVNYIFHSAGVTYIGSSGGNLVSFSDAGQIGGTSVVSSGAVTASGTIASTGGDLRVATGHNLCLDGATCSVAINNNAGIVSTLSGLTATGSITTGGNFVSTAGDFIGAAGKHVCLDGSCNSWITYDSGSGQWRVGNLVHGTVFSIDGAGNVVASSNLNATGITGTSLAAGAGAITGGSLNVSSGAIAGGSLNIGSGGATVGTVSASSSVTAPTLALSSGNNLTMSGSTMVLNVGGATRLSLSTGGVIGAQVGGAYAVGFSTGVSCSGAPTASFATVGGIVTHC